MGAVELTVSDLASSLDYYRTISGSRRSRRGAGRASLGVAGRELLVLVEEPGARSARGHTGLFHFALLVPQRADLARWLAHAARDRVRLEGLSDHNVSEAIYLRDPDGHGIEIYADRPRSHLGGTGREPHDDASARRRRPARPARRPRHGAVRRARGRHRHGPRPPLGRLDPRDRRLLPRRRSASG